MANLSEFRWRVYPDAYQWFRWKREKARATKLFLQVPVDDPPWVPGMPTTDGTEEDTEPAELEFYEYAPITEFTGLYRIFGDLTPTRTEILDFAREFGHLGFHYDLSVTPDHEPGEPLEKWKKEILDMRNAIWVSDLLKEGDIDTLAPHFTWDMDEDQVAFFDPSPEKGSPSKRTKRFFLNEGPDSELGDLIAKRDVFTTARFYLLDQINRRTEEHTYSTLLFNPDTTKLERHDTAKNLVGCMWLQLSRDVDSSREYGICKSCGYWFELLPRKRREHTVYCSRSCRMAAYRERQEEARRLRAKGMKYKDIAKRLDSKVETVKGWVEGRR